MTYRVFVERLAKTKRDSVYFRITYPYRVIENRLALLYDGRHVSVFGLN